MLFAYIDECNPEPNTQDSKVNRFLIFGCVTIDSESVKGFSDAVENIREQYGFLRSDPLKYALSDKPDQVDSAGHKEAKHQALEAAKEFGVKAILYCALHKIIDANKQDVYLNWGTDACLTKLQQLYNEDKHSGGIYCFLDRHTRASMSSYMKSKFQDRNHQYKAGFNTPALVGVAQSWDGTSHLASLCDIIVGSFNYVVHNPTRDIAGKAIMKSLRPLVWGRVQQDNVQVVGRGLLFRPDNPLPIYRPLYDEVKYRVVDWANSED